MTGAHTPALRHQAPRFCVEELQESRGASLLQARGVSPLASSASRHRQFPDFLDDKAGEAARPGSPRYLTGEATESTTPQLSAGTCAEAEPRGRPAYALRTGGEESPSRVGEPGREAATRAGQPEASLDPASSPLPPRRLVSPAPPLPAMLDCTAGAGEKLEV